MPPFCWTLERQRKGKTCRYHCTHVELWKVDLALWWTWKPRLGGARRQGLHQPPEWKLKQGFYFLFFSICLFRFGCHGMWNLSIASRIFAPSQGKYPRPPCWKCGVLTTGPPASPKAWLFLIPILTWHSSPTFQELWGLSMSHSYHFCAEHPRRRNPFRWWAHLLWPLVTRAGAAGLGRGPRVPTWTWGLSAHRRAEQCGLNPGVLTEDGLCGGPASCLLASVTLSVSVLAIFPILWC